MIYHLTQGEQIINQTSIIEWFSFTLSAELFQINIDGQAAMSGDEHAAVLDGVVAADETQAHQEGGLVQTWKCLEGGWYFPISKEKSDGFFGLLDFFVKIQLKKLPALITSQSSRHVRFGDSGKVSVMPWPRRDMQHGRIR